MSNLNVTLSGSVQVVDNTSSNAQIIVNQPFSITLPATVQYYEAFFQALSSGSTVSLPAATVFSAMVVNRSVSGGNNLTVAYTPASGTPGTFILTPGAAWFSWASVETAGGITALTLTGVTGTAQAAVLLAA